MRGPPEPGSSCARLDIAAAGNVLAEMTLVAEVKLVALLEERVRGWAQHVSKEYSGGTERPLGGYANLGIADP